MLRTSLSNHAQKSYHQGLNLARICKLPAIPTCLFIIQTTWRLLAAPGCCFMTRIPQRIGGCWHHAYLRASTHAKQTDRYTDGQQGTDRQTDRRRMDTQMGRSARQKSTTLTWSDAHIRRAATCLEPDTPRHVSGLVGIMSSSLRQARTRLSKSGLDQAGTVINITQLHFLIFAHTAQHSTSSN